MAYLLRLYDKSNHLGPRGDKEQDHIDFDKWIYFLVSSLGPMMGKSNLETSVLQLLIATRPSQLVQALSLSEE